MDSVTLMLQACTRPSQRSVSRGRRAVAGGRADHDDPLQQDQCRAADAIVKLRLAANVVHERSDLGRCYTAQEGTGGGGVRRCNGGTGCCPAPRRNPDGGSGWPGRMCCSCGPGAAKWSAVIRRAISHESWVKEQSLCMGFPCPRAEPSKGSAA